MSDQSDSAAEGKGGDVREETVQKLLKGYQEHEGNAALSDFIGAEFAHDPPTDAERAEAHRRYVHELAKEGVAGLGDPDDAEAPTPEGDDRA